MVVTNATNFTNYTTVSLLTTTLRFFSRKYTFFWWISTFFIDLQAIAFKNKYTILPTGIQTHMGEFCRVAFALVLKTQIYHVFISFYRVQMQNIECIRRTQAPPHTMKKSHRFALWPFPGPKALTERFLSNSAVGTSICGYFIGRMLPLAGRCYF